MGMFTWIILGLIAGILAKLLMPGRDGGGMILTTLLGVAGAFIGGKIGQFAGIGTPSGLDLISIAMATGGAFLLLFVFRLLRGGKSGGDSGDKI
ncbi:MAG: GlsB/YeaQ/YmgE family stress response membrane protein [Gammaproteobacteria bacterium (ex Lamellibrachia satsuma)]|nr:MAG: GlsB/YeaQ/YmgE family stress response membrane protein [Gammaproteobacteria bacterium (ex Lamellibrachia satsuma)]